MNSISGHIIVNSYFNKKRGIAQGIVSSGAGAGLFLIAPLKQYTLSEYGWRGTVLIFAGVVSHFCVCACLMRPFKTNKNDTIASEKTDSDEVSLDIDPILADRNVKVVDKGLSEHIKTQLEDILLGGELSETAIVNAEADDDKAYATKKSKGIIEKTMCDTENGEVVNPLLREGPNGLFRFRHSGSTNGFIKQNLQRHLQRNRCVSEHIPYEIDFGLNTDFCNVSSLPNLSKSHTKKDNKLKFKECSAQNFDPFKRKDICYSGSLYNLKEFQQTNDIKSFVESMTICNNPTNNNNICDEEIRPNTCIYGLKEIARHLCDFSVFRDKIFIPILIGAMFIQMSQYIPNTYIAEYGYAMDLNERQISAIVSIYGKVK